MRIIKYMVIMAFALILAMPMICFNFEPNSISEIDNRELSENPFSEEVRQNGGDLTEDIQKYVNDRIGFRDDMILAHTVINDRLFGKMVHPTYIYGKDGYVYAAGLWTTYNPYSEYHEAFANMVKEIQNYCEGRGVPFIFAFNPAKPAVLTEYVPAGLQYERSWVDQFMLALKERGVRVVDNTALLREKTQQGEVVFNKQYDANHWNDLGAYYGTNAMLEELKKDLPSIHVNEKSELKISEVQQTSLPVSEFPIDEMVPLITFDNEIDTSMTELYGNEIELHPSYRGFYCTRNQERIEEGAPRALVFQGSYMNGFGYKYLANGFGEYIYVHDYQNVLDFAYYFNIFQPDCVIFEVAEYTFSNTYFDYEKMRSFELNPILGEEIKQSVDLIEQGVDKKQLTVERGKQLTKICWNTEDTYDYVWLTLDKSYDMKKTENGYAVTVLTENYRKNKSNLYITTGNEI